MSARPPLPDKPPAPIVSLDEVRRRRQPRQAPAEIEQRDVLAAALRTGRLCAADLFAMVRLGILTDDLTMLPCLDPHRRENAHDWERRYLEAPAEGHPSPSRVGCPLMAQAASGAAPACVEALSQRAQLPTWSPEEGFGRRPLDPEDPVVRSALRPCLVLSRELFRHLLAPLWEEGR